MPSTRPYLRRLPGWRAFGGWLLLAGPVTLLLVVLFFATFTPTAEGAQHGVAGLVQRVVVTEVLATFAALGILAQRGAISFPGGTAIPDTRV